MVLENLRLDNHKVCYRNFSGVGDQYNRQGDRNFAVILTEQEALDLQSRGWPVKITPSRDGNGNFCTMRCKLGQFNPPVYQKSDTAMAKLEGDMLNNLDQIEIDHVDCDLQLVPYVMAGKQGNTVYVHSMCVYQNIDRFSAMYERANKAAMAAPAVNAQTPDAADDLPF